MRYRCLLLITLLACPFSAVTQEAERELNYETMLTYQEFIDKVNDGDITRVEVGLNQITGSFADGVRSLRFIAAFAYGGSDPLLKSLLEENEVAIIYTNDQLVDYSPSFLQNIGWHIMRFMPFAFLVFFVLMFTLGLLAYRKLTVIEAWIASQDARHSD